jgi:hypothetical protein
MFASKGVPHVFAKDAPSHRTNIDNLGKPREHEDVDNPGPILATINSLPLTINPLTL